MKINLLDWVYTLGDKTKPFSVREIIGNRLALTAPDYTRLYLGMEEVEFVECMNLLTPCCNKVKSLIKAVVI